VQNVVVLFRGPSIRQAQIVAASTHPAIVARTARDLIELDDENGPDVRQALDDALAQMRPDPTPA